MRLPLFVVEIAYAEGIEELTSSKYAFVDPSELIVVNPSENEFHTRLEASFSLSKRRNSSASISYARNILAGNLRDMHVSMIESNPKHEKFRDSY